MNTAIIVAAGSGQRFSAAQPKQFVAILGKPLIVYSLEQFNACPAIDEIVLVLSDSGLEEFLGLRDKFPISKLRSIVIGGTTRAESVRNGLETITGPKASVVAIHDGARPLIAVDEITRTVAKAKEVGAACLVAEVLDTIKEVEDGKILGTVDRRSLRRALTPQAFRYDLLVKAFQGVNLSDLVTDECYLVEQLGVKIATVEGAGRNIKVTRSEDILYVESIMRSEGAR